MISPYFAQGSYWTRQDVKKKPTYKNQVFRSIIDQTHLLSLSLSLSLSKQLHEYFHSTYKPLIRARIKVRSIVSIKEKTRQTHPSVGTLVVINFTGYKGCAIVTQNLYRNKQITNIQN